MKKKLFFLFITLYLIPNYPVLLAQWSTDPSQNLQVSTWGVDPHVCTDGKGGAFIAWTSYTAYQRVVVWRLDKYGYTPWDTLVFLWGNGDDQKLQNGQIIADGQGNAYIAFQDGILTDTLLQLFDYGIRIQKVDSMGNKLWGEGLLPGIDSLDQWLLGIVNDNNGGVIVAWIDEQIINKTSMKYLRMQRFYKNGEKLWRENGIVIDDSASCGNGCGFVSDYEGGGIVYYRARYSMDEANWFCKIDSNGTILWYRSIPSYWQYDFKLVGDQAGGVVMSGLDTDNWPTINIIVYRLSKNGDWLWGEEGIIIADSVGEKSFVRDIAIREDSTTIIYYSDVKNDLSEYKSKVQMIDTYGNILFSSGGIYPSLISNINRSSVKIILSDKLNSIYLFKDSRDSLSTLYSQKLDSIGTILWDSSDVIVSKREDAFGFSVVSDLNDGFIIFWDEAPLDGVYAQQVSKNGNLGEIINTIDISEQISILRNFQLYQNYPNPFNSRTRISFTLRQPSRVTLTIYNILGKEVKKYKTFYPQAGKHIIQWDGKNNQGKEVSSGLYLYELKSKHCREVKKMIFLR